MNDKKLIQKLGGSTKVARLLGVSVQRVQNWTTRGIPAAVKLERSDLFLPNLTKSKKINDLKEKGVK